ncbi:ThiF family adenylyltransferase [Rhodopirellula halodulae]|uniref:ThiF family adenylyltransferase n=1 Tax=Rhodopirellula halodulae TaxID=2894198 RepID=UPI001E3E4D84|nr:ThiF family adenylyltransferase [Rhodopirellula sp. JC737]MCC9655925.1 ThiF family adenylyltransferase [Rhodopirellula sp. JC737]
MAISNPNERYLRQSQYAAIGDEGQSKIQASRVAVLGCGALGSVASELLARAGVGYLRLIDRDLIEWSNLQRQSLYTESDAQQALAKAEAAASHLRQINSSITIEEIVADVQPNNIDQLLDEVDLVIDAADNFTLRLLLNDWSLSKRTPWVHGGCVGATGQVRFFNGTSPCFRCLVPDAPNPGDVATCDTAGVIGPATHLIASLQSAEALKFLSGAAQATNSKVLSVDLWRNQFRAFAIDEGLSSQCPACYGGRYDFLNSAEAGTSQGETLCGRNAVQIPGGTRKIDLAKMVERWTAIAPVQSTRFFTRLKLPDDQTLTLFRDGRAVISGVRDIPHARSIYDRYVGS